MPCVHGIGVRLRELAQKIERFDGVVAKCLLLENSGVFRKRDAATPSKRFW